MTSVTGRVRHYGSFYRLNDNQSHGSHSDLLPNVLVYGNCQAEALRILLAGSTSSPVRTMRIPPVFELERSDVRFLESAASNAQILVAQPVSDNYHDLPLGTRQVAAMMAPGSSVIRWPVVRWAGLHPWQAIVRDPLDPAGEPPIVPYHDLRTLASAKAGHDRHLMVPSSESILAVGEASRAELRRREQRDCDVCVSDLLERPELQDFATINHPGNRLLLEIARRVQQAMGDPTDVVDPGRMLLGEVVAPVEQAVSTALGLLTSSGDTWRVGGDTTSTAKIREAHMRWYADRPHVVEAGWHRHRATIDLLGLL